MERPFFAALGRAVAQLFPDTTALLLLGSVACLCALFLWQLLWRRLQPWRDAARRADEANDRAQRASVNRSDTG